MKYNYESIEVFLNLVVEGRYKCDGNKIIQKNGKELVPFEYGKGRYLAVAFVVKGKRHRAFLHRLLFAFYNGIDELKNFEVIDHINGNKYDNRIENLRGLTNSENVHLAKVRLQKGNKLTFEQVSEIKKLLSQGVRQNVIAKQFNVSNPTISYIKKGDCFSYI